MIKPKIIIVDGRPKIKLTVNDATAVETLQKAKDEVEKAKAWAQGTEPEGEGTFSSREFAEESQAWAEGEEPGGEGTKSAKGWAEESEGFRDETSEIRQDIIDLLPNFPEPLIFALNRRLIDEGATLGVKFKPINNILKTIPLDLEWDMLSIPCVHQGDKLFSLIGQDLTVSGGENGSLWDKEGKLVTGLDGGPRYTFDPVTGLYEGVYVEVEKTNLIHLSNELGLEINSTKTLNYGVSPDGNQNSFLVEFGEQNSNGVRFFDIPGLNGLVTFSWFDKSYVIHNYLLRINNFSNQNINSFSFYESNLKWGQKTESIVLVNNEGIGINTRFRNNPLGAIEFYGVQLELGEKTSTIITNGSALTRPADTYSLPNLINPTNPYTKFFIRNGNRLAESYDPQSGQKTIYENGVQIRQEAYTSTDDFQVSSQGSDKYKCFAFKQGALTEQQLIDLTAP